MGFKTLSKEDVRYLVVHCSATPVSMDIGAADIKRWHRQQGFLDIGYHYVIKRNGEIEKGREDNIPGAHARGYNHASLGICLVGGTKKDKKTQENNFTPEQFAAARILLDRLAAEYPDAEVIGHRDLPNVVKGCPSFDAGGWYYSNE